MVVTNVWHARNLSDSPFFQEPLEPASEGSRHPIDLFVGRTEEADRILTSIASSSATRNAVGGVPGVGKTTLVQYVKRRAGNDHGVASTDDWVRVGHAPDTETVLLQILGAAYQSTLQTAGYLGGRNPHDFEPMKAARQMLLAFQSQGVGVSLGAAAMGSLGLTRSVTHVTGGGAVLHHIPILLRQMAEIVAGEAKGRGILVHLNNLEYLTDNDAEKAAAIIRDLRDLAMIIPGYHYLVVGTMESIRQTILSQPQVRGFFGVPEVIRPLSTEDVLRMLELRYDHLRLDREEPVAPLVEGELLAEVYGLFRGDLRGTLRALEQAALRIGALGATPAAPMDRVPLRATLRAVYRQEIEALGPTLASHLSRLAEKETTGTWTKAELGRKWGVKPSRVSQIVSELERQGFMTVLDLVRSEPGRPGRPAELWTLSGAARLAYDPIE